MSKSALLGCVAVLLLANATQGQDLTVYDDALQNSFQNYSFGGVPSDANFTSTAQVHAGTYSIAFTGNNFNALAFARPDAVANLNTQDYPALRFWVHGGAAGNQQLRIYLSCDGQSIANAELDSYIDGGAIAAGAWREVVVLFNQGLLPYIGCFDRIDVQSDIGGGQPTLYIDDVTLLDNSPQTSSLMQIERDVTVASMLSDRFTWQDGSNLPRVAVLAHNNTAAGPGGSQGGALREFRYQLPDGSTRTATVTTYGNAGYGGFGYVVSHASHYAGCVGDDSPLGGYYPGTFERVFEGRHHAIFRFRQSYPRNCSTADVKARTLPVTIDWMFSTGRDNPVWAVTFDVDQAGPDAPAGTFWDDTRAPYGELNIDGSGFEANIDGVAWGDRYKFTSTTAPVTLDSHWTWNQANTIPYVKLWIAGPLSVSKAKDATMGLVQTQTMTQQDAAGGRNPEPATYKASDFWNKTSAQGNAGGAYRMPQQNEWPYQANAFSIGVAVPNNNARLTWGSQYGFLGQTSYSVNDGVVANAPGFPKKSYSTYVVLGTHTSGPVEKQVTQVETVQSLTLSATIGSVATSGAAGITRADNVTYAPPGYDHVYGALAFLASNNQLDANIAVGAGTLAKPLLIVRNQLLDAPHVKLGACCSCRTSTTTRRTAPR